VFLLLAIWAASGGLPTARAALITVSTTVDDRKVNGNCTLREAVLSANMDSSFDDCTAGRGSDIISLGQGTYELTLQGADEDANLTGDIDITSTLMIQGINPNRTRIDARGIDRVLDIHDSASTVIISGVTIYNGNASGVGGGIRADGPNLELINTVVLSNSASAGGGIWVGSGEATLVDSQVISNSVDGNGGGILVLNGRVALTNTVALSNTAETGGGICLGFGFPTGARLLLHGGAVRGNVVDQGLRFGGGIYLDVNAVLTQTGSSQISHNRSYFLGGGIMADGGRIRLSGAQVVGNSAPERGGGIYLLDGATAELIGVSIVSNTVSGGSSLQYRGGGGLYVRESTATLSGGSISGNTADVGTGNHMGGGGIYVRSGILTQTGASLVAANASSYVGGGIYVYTSTVSLNGAEIRGNSAEFGGGLHAEEGTVRGTNVELASNRAEAAGGLRAGYNGDVHLLGGLIYDNVAEKGGGVQVSGGHLALTGTRVVSNAATTTTSPGGGGIQTQGSGTSVSLSGVAIISNTSAEDGGGIFNRHALTAINCTIGGNWAADQGGGLYNYSIASSALTFTTIANNAAGDWSGGVYNGSGDHTAVDVLIADNQPANCTGSGFSSSGHNLESSNTCGFDAASDQTTTDPLLGSLTETSGTLIYPIDEESPAAYSGACIAGIDTDQRGAPRTPPCSIGAYEVAGGEHVFLPLVARES
jgi:CSLREA domain-containing protein